MGFEQHAALDLGRVTAERGAVRIEHTALVADLIGCAKAVPDVGVLGDELEHDLLAATADHDRDRAAHRRRITDRHPLLDHGNRIAEGVQAGDRRAELVAELGVVLLEPARAEPQHQPAPGDVVDRARHVGQQVRIAVRHARDHGADLDPAGRLGECRQRRPALEVRAVGIAVDRKEVVVVVNPVGAQRLGLDPRRSHALERAVLRAGLVTDADRACHAKRSRSRSIRPPVAPSSPASSTTPRTIAAGTPPLGPSTSSAALAS